MNVSAPSSPLVLLAADTAPAARLPAVRNISRPARGTETVTGKPVPTTSPDSTVFAAPVPPAAPPKTDCDFVPPEPRTSSDAKDSPTLDFSAVLNGLDDAVAEIPKPGRSVSLHPAPTFPPAQFHPAPGSTSVPARSSSRAPLSLSPATTGSTPAPTAQAAAPSGLWPASAAAQTERRPASATTLEQPQPDPAPPECRPLTVAGTCPAPANAAVAAVLPAAAHASLPPSPAPVQTRTSIPPGWPARAADLPQAPASAQPPVTAPAASPDPSEELPRASAHPAAATNSNGTDTAPETAASPEPGTAPASQASGANLAGEIAFGARLVVRAAEPVVSDPAPGLASPALPASAAGTAPPVQAPESPAPSAERMSVTASLDAESPGSQEVSQAGAAAAPDLRTGRPAQPQTLSSSADQPNPALAASGSQGVTLMAGYVPPESSAPPPQASVSPAAASQNAVADAAAPMTLRGPAPAPPDIPGSGAARDIALRLSSDDQSAVEVRLSDRAGEVHVAVRSADPQMAESMRAHLPELVDRLGARGFETEIWRPQPATAAERGGFNSHSDAQGGRQSGEGQPQGGSRQKRDQSQPEWMEELAASFHDPTSANRSTNL